MSGKCYVSLQVTTGAPVVSLQLRCGQWLCPVFMQDLWRYIYCLLIQHRLGLSAAQQELQNLFFVSLCLTQEEHNEAIIAAWVPPGPKTRRWNPVRAPEAEKWCDWREQWVLWRDWEKILYVLNFDSSIMESSGVDLESVKGGKVLSFPMMWSRPLNSLTN